MPRLPLAGVPWLSTKFSFPAAIAQYLGGYLVQNRGTSRITMLWPNGTSTTAAGTGTCGLVEMEGKLRWLTLTLDGPGPHSRRFWLGVGCLLSRCVAFEKHHARL